jgi:hypothetical protein
MHLDETLNTFGDVLRQLSLCNGTWRTTKVLGRNLPAPWCTWPLSKIRFLSVKSKMTLDLTSNRMDTEGPQPSNINASLSTRRLVRDLRASSNGIPHSLGCSTSNSITTGMRLIHALRNEKLQRPGNGTSTGCILPRLILLGVRKRRPFL